MRVGLVLGAGGVVGHAYHAGVLAALERDLGWDARDAEVIVGTSAGALTGALLRLGVGSDDLAAWNVDARLSADAERIRGEFNRPALPPFSFSSFARWPRLPEPSLLWSWLRSPLATSPVALLLAMLPDGKHDLAGPAARLDNLSEQWPQRKLWINALRRHDLRRVVFGRDMDAPLSAAVTASCAVPGLFEPTRINGHAFIDGGVHSPTNADVLIDDPVASELDLLVVVSPMTASSSVWRRPDGLMRVAAQRTLDRELRRAGSGTPPVAIFAPGAATLKHITFDFMSEVRLRDLVREAFLEAGAHIGAAPVLRTWRTLQTRRVAATMG
jgi:NTE family protein